MAISAVLTDERVAEVTFTDDSLSVRLMDGRAISVPLAWYPRLLKASPKQRASKDWWTGASTGTGTDTAATTAAPSESPKSSPPEANRDGSRVEGSRR